jgi:hypothetical protein
MSDIKTIKLYIEVLENMLSWEDSDIKIEALREAISLLNKQIPKQPIKDKWLPTICPTCRGSLS